jgi:hypothetical protein
MVLEHAAAAAVVGLWLACGERAVWALVRLATATFRRFARPPSCRPVHGPPRVVPVDPVLLPPTSPALAATVRLRGPPTGLPA